MDNLRGFDTRGTQYSGARLAWESVAWPLQQGNRVPIENDEQAATRLIPASQQPESLLATTGKASAGAAAAAGRAQIPCYGSPIPASSFFFELLVPYLANWSKMQAAQRFYRIYSMDRH
ncbi:unnamed protein product [Anisakis simplex]|uniref:Uncharacterized protein n=1 Tax=Anisakis simplex TaxID=6269 RepID=A0A0M3JH09_ANISI|nr:unnamed protein product [Anisakis simplex]